MEKIFFYFNYLVQCHLVKTQLFIAGGYRLEDQQIKIANQEAIKVTGYALQCRITTEDPQNDFKPDWTNFL